MTSSLSSALTPKVPTPMAELSKRLLTASQASWRQGSPRAEPCRGTDYSHHIHDWIPVVPCCTGLAMIHALPACLHSAGSSRHPGGIAFPWQRVEGIFSHPSQEVFRCHGQESWGHLVPFLCGGCRAGSQHLPGGHRCTWLLTGEKILSLLVYILSSES